MSSTTRPTARPTARTLAAAVTTVLAAGGVWASTGTALAAAAALPGAPTGLSGTAGDSSAALAWTAPRSTGGSPLTGYLATCAGSGQPTRTATSTATQVSVAALMNGTTYTCSVQARTAAGTGPASAAVTVQPTARPGAPRSVTAATSPGAVAVRWSPPATGAGAVTGYAVTCSSADGGAALSGSAAASARALTLTGLTTNRSYTCAVTATSPSGSSPAGSSAVVEHAQVTAGSTATLHLPFRSGQRVSAAAARSTLPDSTDSRLDLLGRDGTVQATGFVDAAGTAFTDATPVQTAAGTAQVVLSGATAGTAELTGWSSTDVSRATTVGAAPTTITTTTPGQRGTVTFAGTAGEQVSVAASTSTTTDYTDVDLSLQGSTGVWSGTLDHPSGSLWSDVLTLPATGTYVITVDPRAQGRGSVSVSVAAGAGDITATTTVGGAAVPVRFTRPGQKATVTFSGAAGQQVRLTAAASGTSDYTDYALTAPSGSTLWWGTLSPPSNSQSSGVVTLPASGSYALVLDPWGEGTGTVTVTVAKG